MPRIRNLDRSVEYSRIRDTAPLATAEAKDCTVVALAAATGISYDLAHTDLKSRGRQDRKGASMVSLLDAISSYGYETHRLLPSTLISTLPGRGKDLKFLTTYHPRRYPGVFAVGKTYVALTSGGRHVMVIKDGVAHDWSAKSALRICVLYEVKKKEV